MQFRHLRYQIVPGNSPEARTVTDWMTALGTVGALIVSLLLGFTSIVLAYNDRKAKRRSEITELRRVFARVETDEIHVSWRVTNASRFPIRQVHITAIPFVTEPAGKHVVAGGLMQQQCPDIDPDSVVTGKRSRQGDPQTSKMIPCVENAVRLDFIDYQGTHWVREANGTVTRIEKLKGGGFAKLPRTLYETDRESWFSRLQKKLRQSTGQVRLRSLDDSCLGCLCPPVELADATPQICNR